MDKCKDVLTTGQVAKICNVAPRTVSKWFDNGQLRGYRIPGSKDRRIPRQQLVRFMKAHGIPLNGLESGNTRVLVVDRDVEFTSVLNDSLEGEFGYEVRTATGVFEAGALAESFRPHVIVIDVSMPDVDAQQLCRHVHTNPELEGIRLLAMSGAMTEGQGHGYIQSGFNNFLRKPFEIRQLVDLIEQKAAAVEA